MLSPSSKRRVSYELSSGGIPPHDCMRGRCAGRHPLFHVDCRPAPGEADSPDGRKIPHLSSVLFKREYSAGLDYDNVSIFPNKGEAGIGSGPSNRVYRSQRCIAFLGGTPETS